jgi:hypothetical protein
VIFEILAIKLAGRKERFFATIDVPAVEDIFIAHFPVIWNLVPMVQAPYVTEFVGHVSNDIFLTDSCQIGKVREGPYHGIIWISLVCSVINNGYADRRSQPAVIVVEDA